MSPKPTAPEPFLVPTAPGTCGPLPIVEELPETLDAWEAARRLARLDHLVFLDSANHDSPLGRHSFVAAGPFVHLRYDSPNSPDPFTRLAEVLARYPAEPIAGLPPFQGGLAGLFGYDLCHYVERLPRPRFNEFRPPDLAVGLYDWVLSFDHDRRRTWLVSTGFPETEPARRRDRAARRAREVLSLLSSHPAAPRSLRGSRLAAEQLCRQYPLRDGVSSNFSPDGYRATVQRAIDCIHAGDCFQVNLSQRLLAPSTEPPLELYGRLRLRNAAPFAGYLDLGDFAVASASPERFLKMTHGEVETRPIKGTRPRGATPEEDERLRRSLATSAKDRAENVMIVDLLRNDLGRVCSYGSVRVEALCRLESYRHVHHLVSEVRGQIRAGLGPMDLLRATFPGGSVTGAPKVRAMEIIAELEPTARGPYCGSLGYVGFDGSMDLNLLIRTFTIGHGWVQFPVGGGIVADSTPEAEYAETLHKAEGLLRALPK